MICAALGDTHGNYNFLGEFLEKHVKTLNIELVIQLGDFGFVDEPKQLDDLNDLLEKLGCELWWIDGNHEHHHILRETYQQNNYDTLITIRENIMYIPRGFIWQFNDIKFMGFGGAYSIDKAFRTPGINWFPEEMPTDEEIDRANARGKVDVLFTHDVPEGTPFITKTFAGKTIEGALWSRRKSLWVAEKAQPKLIVHGHYHYPYKEFWDAPWGKVKVIGLDSDYTSTKWDQVFTVIDTKNFSKTLK